MAPKSIFKQPGARHFQLVHRSQRDPLIHDAEASKHVLKPIERANARKGKSRVDLENALNPDDLAHDLSRANIGEAALYGVYYDDTEYDYMQHLRTVGLQEAGVESVLLEAPNVSSKSKKQSKKLGRHEHDLFHDLPEEALPSKIELPRELVTQNAVPDEISGLQPDMDPHLRQTLEALDDEAFVDDDLNDDFFQELVGGGERDSDDPEFEFHEDGGSEDKKESTEAQGWEERFKDFKREQTKGTEQAYASDSDDDFSSDELSEAQDTMGELPVLPISRKRRRKGQSDASGYSMSSSSMFRNAGLTLLDERFDKVDREYSDEEEEIIEDDEDDEAPPLITTREDFDSIMDDFLDKYEILGGKMKQVLPGGTNVEKLGTFRSALVHDGPIVMNDDDDEEQDVIGELVFEEDKRDRWDCETILSTYSNLENHPRIIRARSTKTVPRIQLNPKTGLPSVDPPNNAATKAAPKDDIARERPPSSTISRRKDESKEEKKSRKGAVKEERQARRAEKRATKEQFSKEKKQQLNALANRDGRGVRKL